MSNETIRGGKAEFISITKFAKYDVFFELRPECLLRFIAYDLALGLEI